MFLYHIKAMIYVEYYVVIVREDLWDLALGKAATLELVFLKLHQKSLAMLMDWQVIAFVQTK